MPKYAEAYFMRGKICFELKRYKEAIEDWEKANELKPDYATKTSQLIESAKKKLI